MPISEYGFFEVLGEDVVLDPSRVAAQVGAAAGASLPLLAIATTVAYFKVADINVDRHGGSGPAGAVSVALEVHGPGSVAELAASSARSTASSASPPATSTRCSTDLFSGTEISHQK